MNSDLETAIRDLGFKKIDLLLYFLGILDFTTPSNKSALARKELFKNFIKVFRLEESIPSSFFKEYLSENFILNQKGFNRIRNIIPRYHGKRKWDNFFYFVSFDIPEKFKIKREVFRKFLKEKKFGLIQDSVWINVFDYSGEIIKIMKLFDINASFVNQFKGEVLGIVDYKEFANNIWNIKAINDLYNEYIANFSLVKDLRHSLVGQLRYLTILKKDPQLPQEFLDHNWKAHIANELYQRLINSFFIEFYQ